VKVGFHVWSCIVLLLAMLDLSARAAAQSTIFVNSATSGTGGCSLVEAIYAANFDANIALNDGNNAYVSGCLPGSGADTIVLQAGQTYTFDTIVNDFNNYMGSTATPIIFTDITIQANGATLQRALGAPNMRLFSVGTANFSVTPPGGPPFNISGTGSLTIQNAYIKGFQVKGGNGTDGGGGGMGAGGAIYLSAGSLTVDNSTFDSNGALGGNGSAQLPGQGGGGGGGFGGNGGHNNFVGGGGGGGGARGDGAQPFFNLGVGGGGGGTVTAGKSDRMGGLECGANGSADSVSNDGDDASCPGGGGGGGGGELTGLFGGGDGGHGAYGGGGGGGGFDNTGTSGGDGGFGGGGGSGTALSGVSGSPNGGNGGFGGGGGSNLNPGHSAGPAGILGSGGRADTYDGAGGSALGGAIFSNGATVIIRNSTFFNNSVFRGNSGGGTADNGVDAGGAIFSLYGSLTILNSTISNNHTSPPGAFAGVYVDNEARSPGPPTSFTIRNTIVASNGERECAFNGPVNYTGSNNLIVNDFGCTGPGLVSGLDPLLGPLQINAPGNTPTMALQPGSPAIDAGDDSNALPADQNGVVRPQGPQSDIGAFEAPPPSADVSLSKSASSGTAQIGDTLTYTLTVANAGPDTATGVTVSDSWPSQLTFVSCSATGGGTCVFTGAAVNVSYATLTKNETETITIQGTLNAGAQDNLNVINTATATAASPADPNTSNNSASASFTVQNNSDLSVSQSADKLTNRQLNYTISVSNLGTYPAKQLVLTDTIPPGSEFVSIAPGPWSCSAPAVGSNGPIGCLLNTEDVNATQTLIFVVRVRTPANVLVDNTAAITSATFDPNLSNNTSTLSLKVGPGQVAQ
jgi:uncharacterized repeat protein (TIGR01451 family)